MRFTMIAGGYCYESRAHQVEIRRSPHVRARQQPEPAAVLGRGRGAPVRRRRQLGPEMVRGVARRSSRRAGQRAARRGAGIRPKGRPHRRIDPRRLDPTRSGMSSAATEEFRRIVGRHLERGVERPVPEYTVCVTNAHGYSYFTHQGKMEDAMNYSLSIFLINEEVRALYVQY